MLDKDVTIIMEYELLIFQPDEFHKNKDFIELKYEERVRISSKTPKGAKRQATRYVGDAVGRWREELYVSIWGWYRETKDGRVLALVPV